MIRAGALVAVIALVACGNGTPSPPPSPPPIVLAEQPVITDGFRSNFSLDLDAFAPAERTAALDRAVLTLRRRLQLANVRGRVAIDDKQQVVVDLGTLDSEVLEHATSLLTRRGRFEVHVVVANPPAIAARAKADPAASAVEITTTRDGALIAPDREERVAPETAKPIGCVHPHPGEQGVCAITGRRAIETYVAALHDPALAISPTRELVFERLPADPELRDRRVQWRSYVVERTSALTGDAIARATVAPRAPDDPDSIVTLRLELDAAGTAAFAALTEHHVGDKLAMLLDDTVANAPVIEAAVRGGSIGLRLTSATDARELAIVLGAGALPAPMVLESRGLLVHGVARYETD